MKTITLIFYITCVCFGCIAKEVQNPLMASRTVVWAGLDYSLVRMIGGTDFDYDFDIPEVVTPNVIFPTMFEKWNKMFIDEQIDRVEYALGRRVIVEISGVTDRNKLATTNQVVLSPDPKYVVEESHITPKEIAAEVQSYKMQSTNGLGMVFIVDRLVCRKKRFSVTKAGAVYVVFFDVATREIISAKREVKSASGGLSFRNYWFRPIKEMVGTLGKYRVSDDFYDRRKVTD